MLLGTTVELYDGLVARGIPGQGRPRRDPRHRQVRRDPRARRRAGRRRGAGRSGSRPDRGPCRRPGGAHRRAERGRWRAAGEHRHHRRPAGAATGSPTRSPNWPTYPDVLHLQRTTAFGHYDDGFVLALQRRTDHLGADAPAGVSRQRVWRIRARHVVVAAGAHERPVVFTDNDRPGIMLAHGARTFLHRYGVKVGEQAVVFTTNDSAYLAALDLHDAGVRINAVVDARSDVGAAPARGVRRPRHHAADGIGGQRHAGRRRGSPPRWSPARGSASAAEPVDCDVLLVSGGWNPAVHLFSQVRGKLRYDDALGALRTR